MYYSLSKNAYTFREKCLLGCGRTVIMFMDGECVCAAVDLTGDGGGVVWRVCSQILCGLSGGLRKTLGAPTVTLTRRK